ncbi:MAG TPA: ABC transporter ATP-binding protein [Candidatus Limnocylindria bacterium]|nr:ABC transporter ATP-binding protein [Candidatus Limnocylindria bacterium]
MATPAAAPAVEAAGWGWRHPGRTGWAVRHLDLTIAAGERVLLLGASGSGKSTLLTHVAGLADDRGGGESEGELRVFGGSPVAARSRTALVMQDPESQIVMSRAGDDVAFGLENRGVPTDEIWPAVRAALQTVGWPYGPGRPTDQLSGGELQRLALAGILALKPDVLLLDEPTANLDPDGAAALRAALARILEAHPMTLVLVEHRVAEWLPLVTRVVVMAEGGAILLDGPPADVFVGHDELLDRHGIWTPGHAGRRPARPLLAPPVESLIVAEQLSARPPLAERPIFTRLDLTVRTAEALAVIGPNGSGKSTLARLLGGLLRPQAGEVTASEAMAPGHAGSVIWRWPARELVTRIGSVFQDPEHQFLTGRVADELALGPIRAGLAEPEARQRATELAERLRLDSVWEANPFTLSGGEKRRLSVATALATAPRAVILDEPTFGQDRRTWDEMLSLLAGLVDSGRAVVMATHDRALVDALADRTLTLRAPEA